MVTIRNHSQVSPFVLPGPTASWHRTLAGPAQGLMKMEVWLQSLGAGAATPPHSHDCEEVIVVLSGRGVCLYQGQELPFVGPATLIIPPGVVHQVCNTGEGEMVAVAALSMAGVVVKTPDGAPFPLPWATS